ncbi:FAD-binding protein [uncultured Ilyobacter sp.]|uniref:FAD-binding protein n=1 Tax=uncultured Ilyobacter sp. TaxID=544433 RepID=UPI002AA83A11|nr:FAD-binding protein [uncultured Ilyobacter sp.]
MYVNRRAFIKGAFGIGVAGAAIAAGLIKNRSPKKISQLMETALEQETDILVIGGGIAGVFAALRASRNGAKVILVDKGSVGRSGQTPFANGFAVFDEANGDDRATWHKNMATNTDGIHRPEYLDQLMDYSKEIYEEMESWGATKVGFGKVFREKLCNEGIQIIERTMLTTLLEKNGKVAGAVGFKLDSEEAVVVKAKSVILCTGAGAFKPNGFQVRSLTNDGDAMAYRIGGKISGKEFVDTHFTGSDNPAYCWGNWKNQWETGIMKVENGPEANGMGLDLNMYHSAHAANIPVTMGPPGGGDVEKKPPESMGPGKKEPGMEGGKPPGMGDGDPIGGSTAGMGVHKSEGLFPTDAKCGTNIEGLFAAGDSLSSMLVGGKYVGVIGFALAGSATQGALAGEVGAEYIKTSSMPKISDTTINAIKEEMFAPREREKGYSPAWVTQMLQFNMIPYYVLYIKKEDRLKAALKNIEFFRDHFADKMIASDAHDLRLVHETKNMILNAEMKLKASLFRTESRGNHYREDYPETNDKDWLAWVVIEKDKGGEMKLSKVPVNG